MGPYILYHVVCKPRRRHGDGGNTVIPFNCPAMSGDRRRAAVSTTHPKDHGISLLLDLGP